ncbi:MAG TPA: hypothetical protein VIQ30_25785 [Pseudonocardia sp.]
MTPLTGNDVADLHLVADAHHCTWVTTTGLTTPYIIDHDNRCVWVNGRLDLPTYFEAIRCGIDEIVRNLGTDTVVPFRQRNTG